MNSSTSFLDKLFLALLMFVMMVVVMFPHLNPPANESDNLSDPPGNLVVNITWPEGRNDVDLWTLGPGEPRAVGYSNKGGVLWNLLRDDLGMSTDFLPENFENAFSRGVPDGRYWVNVHCYRCSVLPVPVKVEISLKSKKGNSKARITRILTTEVVLDYSGEEVTVVSFRIDKNKLLKGSLNHLYKPLRTASK